ERAMTEAERRQFAVDRSQLADSLAEVERRLNANGEALNQVATSSNEQTRQATADRFIALLVELSNIAGEATLIQARARLEQISVERIDLEPPVALEIARANRVDWMNARASVVDTWRLIEFNANALKAVLNVGVNGSIQTKG